MNRIFLLLMVFSVVALRGIGQAGLADYFVGTGWLADHRNEVVLLDVRGSQSYARGHLEGAYPVPHESFLQTRNRVNNMLPDPAVIRALLGSLGVSPKSTLVVYAEDDNPFAARLVWTLRSYGVGKAFVLDGGYTKWQAEGRPTGMETPARPKVSDYALPAAGESPASRADAAYVHARLENPGVIIWDARSPEEYAGTRVLAARGGHIPGAISLNWTELLKEVDGVRVLKSRAEILALLKAHGISPDKEVVAHCQTGVRSAYVTLVLQGLGYDKVKNYDGSWLEWGNNPALPVVQGQGADAAPSDGPD